MSQEHPWEEIPVEGAESAPVSAVAPAESALVSAAAPAESAPMSEVAPTESAPGVSGWTRAEASYAGGEILELVVSGYNRGGLLVDLGDARGFVPASQLSHLPRQLTEEQRMQELARCIGQTLKLKVIEFDRARNRLVLSERVASPPLSRADQTLAGIEPQSARAGVIRNVTDFGAFVDLGGVEGLIHVSEMAWQHVKHPRDVVVPGQQVQVYIMEVNREQRRVACSLKRLMPNPWAVVAEKVKPGDCIEGAVTTITDFGAFVRVADGVEGLIHVSEMGRGSFLHPRDAVREGQSVRARVLSIEPERQRMSLSLWRAAEGAPTSAADAAIPPPPDEAYWTSLVQSET